jgi:hypothetical protein
MKNTTENTSIVDKCNDNEAVFVPNIVINIRKYKTDKAHQ